MSIVIIEIKARCLQPDRIRSQLESSGARYVGEDHQVDTYFRVPAGRFKLREGLIENSLIFYERADDARPRRSDVHLFKTHVDSGLKKVLEAALPVLAVVDKRRHIYFIDNVKFHLDLVVGLGSFVEIEAIDENGERDEAALRRQCDGYMAAFAIRSNDLMTGSYSDMVMNAG